MYASELKGKKRSDNVEGRGNAWLKQQPLHIRQAILGVKGEQEWKAGRAGWMEKARNYEPTLSGYFGKIDRIKNYIKMRLGKITEWEYNERVKLDVLPKTNGNITLEENVKSVNPSYSMGDSYKLNCQMCVPTFELRMREYDVWARGNTFTEEQRQLITFPFSAFHGESKVISQTSEDGGMREISDFLRHCGNNSRVEIAFYDNHTNKGHVIVGINQKGKVQFIDVQSGSMDCKSEFKKGTTCSYMRIDNIPINQNMIKVFCEWRGEV